MATGSDEYYDHTCTPCEEDGQKIEATHYCKNCAEKFCDTCMKHHNKILRKHTVLGTNDFDQWFSAIQNFPKDHVFSVQSAVKANVRAKGDDNVCIAQDLCPALDGRTLLVDIGNKGIKVLDKNYKVTKTIPFPESFMIGGLCHIKGNEFIACAGDGAGTRKIIMFNLKGDVMDITDEFLVNHAVARIRHDNGRLYVTCCDGLYVYSIAGRLNSVLFKDISKDGCGDIAFSDHGKKLHVIHVRQNKLTTINDKGKVLASYTDTNMQFTHSVVLHANGAIFFCGNNGETGKIQVTQLNANGSKQVGTLLEQDFTDFWPGSLCFNHQTGELVVAGKGDTVLVLKLQ